MLRTTASACRPARAGGRQPAVLLLPPAEACGVALAAGGKNNEPGPPHVLLRAVAVSDDRLQAHPIRRRNGDGNSFAHHRQSHETSPSETPFRTLLLGVIH